MNNYIIEIELLSEAIFGSGQSVPGLVDTDIVHDEYGFPYMKAKTFKGNLRKSAEEIVELLKYKYKKDYSVYLEELFGKSNNWLDNQNSLKFSDCCLDENVRKILINAVLEKKIRNDEILDSLTEIRSFTSIDADGSAKKGSLRQARVIKRGLKFYTTLESSLELTDIKLSIIAAAVCSLRHIGSMRTRGKGEVSCRLLKRNGGLLEDITGRYVSMLIDEVKKGE